MNPEPQLKAMGKRFIAVQGMPFVVLQHNINWLPQQFPHFCRLSGTRFGCNQHVHAYYTTDGKSHAVMVTDV
jgi:hypothetical protein